MYTDRNFKTKKALKAAVDEYNLCTAHPEISRAPPVTYYQPGPFGGEEQRNGLFYVEGPHYPEPHRWYAMCTAENGIIVKVK